MRPSALLAIHDSAHDPLGISTNIGDEVLCATNQVYRAIREQVLLYGVEFINDGQLWNDYSAFPLLCLEDLMSMRQLPYFDNVSVLRRLVASGRDPELADRLLADGLRKNFLLHESSHAVFSIATSEQPLPELPEYSETLLASIASEAFANSMEQLALGCCPSPEHKRLLSLNTYNFENPLVSRVVTELIRVLTPAALLPYAFVCFFLSNQLSYVASLEIAKRIIELYPLGLEKYSEAAAFRTLLTRFSLNPSFVGETSIAYFTMAGLDQEFRGLSWHRFLEPSTPRDWLLEVALRASRIITLRDIQVSLAVGGAA